jgi:hypothetical protein
MITWYRGPGRIERRSVRTFASGSILASGFSLGFFTAGILSGMGALFTDVFSTEPLPPDISGHVPLGLSREASVPNLKFATVGEPQIRNTSALFSVACWSQKPAARCDELPGQDTRA